MIRSAFLLSSLLLGLFVVVSSAQVPNPRNPRIGRQTTKMRSANLGRYGRGGFGRLDLNRDGYISLFEWRGNRRGFDRLDWNNDGLISRLEWRNRR
jgi:hypothetical protein